MKQTLKKIIPPVYKRKIRTLLETLSDRVNYKKLQVLPNLAESQYWSVEKMQEFQSQRLRYIVKYAYENIPGYRKKYDEAGLKPKHIQTIADLHKIPVLTKAELRDNEDFINRKKIKNILHTGGSTGSSLKYYDCFLAGHMRMDIYRRGWSYGGYQYNKSKRADLCSAYNFQDDDLNVNLYGDLTETNIKKNIEILQRTKPEFIRGYVGSLFIMARYCLDNNIKFEGLKSITPMAENLYDYQRELIEKAFECEIFEGYGCNDGGGSAFECEVHDGLHFASERAIFESLDDGEMLLTDLWNTAMPFIRYANGDKITVLDRKCSCGRTLPLIKVKGRDNDIIITPDGVVSPIFLMHIGENYRSGISHVQYVQKTGYILEVNVVKNSWCTDEEINNYKIMLETTRVKGMQVKINLVDEIPKSPRGKRQFIINEDKELLSKYLNKF